MIDPTSSKTVQRERSRARLHWIVLGIGAVIAIVVALWPRSAEAPHKPTTSSHAPSIPRIDVHTHIAPTIAGAAIDLLRRNGIGLAINASGGSPRGGLEQSVLAARATKGRLLYYCNIGFRGVESDQWAAYVVQTLTECKRMGAVGVKIFKSLGLGIPLSNGALLRVDDPRLDVLFEKAGELSLPVLIHSGDPKAFFRPPTEDNERIDELRAHPDWSFYGPRPDNGEPWPSWEDVFSQFERRVARHPNTTFVGAHFGNDPEDPSRVATMLDRNPKYVIETGARIPEIGRHSPGTMKAFFERYADRIMFGSDFTMTEDMLVLGSSGEAPDTLDRVGPFFDAHWRYFETSARNFAHPTPIQGRWTIHGLGLPRPVLEKVYYRNAMRVFGIRLPAN